MGSDRQELGTDAFDSGEPQPTVEDVATLYARIKELEAENERLRSELVAKRMAADAALHAFERGQLETVRRDLVYLAAALGGDPDEQ